ncbi:MAG: cobalt ECF transporter T component CbiQ [Nitriliruptoraceae bacterium]
MSRAHVHALYVHEHSRAHRLPPHVKIIALLAFTVCVATTPNESLVAFGGLALLVAFAAAVARLPARYLLARLAVVTPFLLVALLLPFVASGPRTTFVGVPLATAGLWGALGLGARAVLGAAASLVLVATTEVAALLRGLERLRVPRLITAIAAFMLRYLEVVADEFMRQRRAMVARGYDPRSLWQARVLATGMGTLFIRAYERGERVYAAMRARGFTGAMPVLHHESAASPGDWGRALVLPAAAFGVRLVDALVVGV